MKTQLILMAIAALSAEMHALNLGPFNNVANGVFDTWNQSHPDNVRGGFSARYGKGKLWLVSKRLHRVGFQDPWDSAARGGIVSTLQLSTKTWTHKTYDRLDQDGHGDKIFVLHGHLFMLTYSMNQNRIAYQKLFTWNDQEEKWLAVPFDIDPSASTATTNSIQTLTVLTPKQNGTVAYAVASAHGQARPGSELAFAKLEVEFRGTVAAKATLKSITHERVSTPSAVIYTTVKDDKLYAFVQHFYSEGYVAEYQNVYVLDLTSKQLSNVSLGGIQPAVDYAEHTMHHAGNEILIVGGRYSFGLGQLRTVDDIFVLDLNNLQWQKTTYKIPSNAGRKSAYDQEGKRLFLIGLNEG